MKKNEIYEQCNEILKTAIEYGEAQRDVERQLHNDMREEPIEDTIKYSHEMFNVLTTTIWDFAEKIINEKKEADQA